MAKGHNSSTRQMNIQRSKSDRSRVDQELVHFVKDILLYIYTRLRQVAVLLWISAEVASEAGVGIKRKTMSHVFWGRGNWYRFIVMSAIGVSVVTLPFTLYREPVTQKIYAEELSIQEVSQVDLLVESGSSQTLIPKGRPRMETVIYTVKGGDTLSIIAEKNDISVQTLLWANDMTEYDFIKPGQELKIPPSDGVLHKVGSGDTLSGLAKKYEAAEQAIADANWLFPPFELEVGTTLFIPKGTMPPPPAPPTPIASSGYSTGYTTPQNPPAAAPSATRFLGWPVAGGRGVISQCPSGWHMAIDIADSGAPMLVASAAGTVTFAGMSDPWGYAWSVQIDHGNGLSTFYAHMSSISVVSGQYVGKGQVIGRMGSSGLATGVHVHFELRAGSGWASRVNPSPYMQVHVCGY